MDNEKILFDIPKLYVNLRHIEGDGTKTIRSTHFHNEIELVRVDAGEISCIIGEKDIPLKKGDVMLINRRVVHRLSFSYAAKITYIQIDINRYEKRFSDLTEKRLWAFMTGKGLLEYSVQSNEDEIGKCLFSIEKELSEKALGFDSYITAGIFSIIAYMHRHSMLPDYEKIGDRTALAKLMPAIYYAEENFRTKIYLDDAAKLLNMDKFYFCKLFKKTVGTTFTDYVNSLRLESSIELLLESDATVSDIAYECGFATLQYFNRLFKKHNGCTPREYRKLYRT